MAVVMTFMTTRSFFSKFKPGNRWCSKLWIGFWFKPHQNRFINDQNIEKARQIRPWSETNILEIGLHTRNGVSADAFTMFSIFQHMSKYWLSPRDNNLDPPTPTIKMVQIFSMKQKRCRLLNFLVDQSLFISLNLIRYYDVIETRRRAPEPR